MRKEYILLGVLMLLIIALIPTAQAIPMFKPTCVDNQLWMYLNMTINGETYEYNYTISDIGCSYTPLELFLVFQIMAFVLFVVAMFKPYEIIFSLAAMVMFFSLSVQSGSIALIPSMTAMLLNFGLAVVTLIFLVYQTIFLLPKRAMLEREEEG